MGRKKKIDFGFTPSIYQQKIFDFITDGVGNASISARAGAAKTTTIISAMKLIPSKQKCLFLAFNKSIAEELTNKLKELPNVQVKTLHSLGFLMLRRNIGNEIELDEYKYRTYLKSNITELSNSQEQITTREQLNEYLTAINNLINYARFNYCQSVKEIDDIAKKYTIPINYDECEVTYKVLEWGKTNTNIIDFTDMVWLPVELNMKPMGLQYDWVMVDESQDMSVVGIELFKKCFKRSTRAIFVGDEKQAIYAFSGSNELAFNTLQTMPNTQLFELPISYRCDKEIVKIANNYVPDMQPRDTADEGKIIHNCSTIVLKDGDMVLARTKAPLVKLYTRLLKRGVSCYIKGQDIASNLIKILEDIDDEVLNKDLNSDGVFVKLFHRLFINRNKLMERRGLDFDDATLSSSIMEQYDNINTLMTLSEKCKTKHELINHIKSIFAEEQYGVCLSTIHKAKGLEADNVYILCRSTMPSKLAQQDWERKQEENLIYVAYTRAKHTLGFISEKEIAPCGSSDEPMKIINDLMFYENKVCKVLGLEPTVRMSNVDVAKFNLKIATQIEEEKEIKKLEKIKTLEHTDDLLMFLSKKIQKDIDNDFVEYTPDGDFLKVEPPEDYNFFDDDN